MYFLLMYRNFRRFQIYSEDCFFYINMLQYKTHVIKCFDAIIGRKENTMEYLFVTECICINLMNAVFSVRISNVDGNLIGNANVIVNSDLECDSEFEEYSKFPNFVKTEAEKRCIKRAKFIFYKKDKI